MKTACDLLNRVLNVEVSDTTEDDSSNTAKYKISGKEKGNDEYRSELKIKRI